MRAAQRGQPDERVGNETKLTTSREIQWDNHFWTAADNNYNQIGEICPFPYRTAVVIDEIEVWWSSATEWSADSIVNIAIIPADGDESTLTGEEYNARQLFYDQRTYIAAGTVGNLLVEYSSPTYLFPNVTFTSGDMGKEGIYFYSRTNNFTNGPSINAKSRVVYSIFWVQNYYSDTYVKKGKRITEGWAGYEWEESFCESEM